jgi:uncharacterized protein
VLAFCRYLPTGFIVNNVQVQGSLLCLPDTWLLWDVTSLDQVNRHSLAILDLVAPRPQVGGGLHEMVPSPVALLL